MSTIYQTISNMNMERLTWLKDHYEECIRESFFNEQTSIYRELLSIVDKRRNELLQARLNDLNAPDN